MLGCPFAYRFHYQGHHRCFEILRIGEQSDGVNCVARISRSVSHRTYNIAACYSVTAWLVTVYWERNVMVQSTRSLRRLPRPSISLSHTQTHTHTFTQHLHTPVYCREEGRAERKQLLPPRAHRSITCILCWIP